ncbi:MAG: CAP domain-containing protein [Deltaproteobacteria bacterium]|nr:CAP domain-containing protein [Deltaproteobacteria bacterium]
MKLGILIGTLWAALSLGCAGGKDAQVLESLQGFVSQNPGALEDAIVAEVNRVRATFNDPAVLANPAPEQRAPLKRHIKPGAKTLDDVAKAHSQAIHEGRFLQYGSCQETVTYTGQYWTQTFTWTSFCPHYNPMTKTTAWKRVDDAEINNKGVGEVVAGLPFSYVGSKVSAQDIAKQIVDLWMGSTEHRKQILDVISTGPYTTSTGVGIFLSDSYNMIIATELFIRD